MLTLKQVFESLPPAQPSTIRVIRVESKTMHTMGVASSAALADKFLSKWWELPTPQAEGLGEGWPSRGWVCAAHAHTFHEWFSGSLAETLAICEQEGYHIVILDVPKGMYRVGSKQAVIDRHASVVQMVLQ